MKELLDLERVRWFTALSEFSGDGHGFANFNMKGYCDPVSLKAEFLIWDTRFGDWSSLPDSQFAVEGTQFLRVDEFRLLHDRALYELATERVEPMLDRMREFYASQEQLMGQDPLRWFPRGGPDGGFPAQRLERLEKRLTKNAADIRVTLEGRNLGVFVDPEERLVLCATTDRGSKHVEALLLAAGDGAPAEVALEEPVVVPGVYRDRHPVMAFELPAGIDPASVRGVLAKNDLTGEVCETTVLTERPVGVQLRHEPSTISVAPDLPEGFVADTSTRTITAGPGRVGFEGITVLPDGWSLDVLAGTTLVGGPDALLEVHGDLRLQGTAEEPIRIVPREEEASLDWGALAVVGERTEPTRVEVSHTTMVGGRGSNDGTRRFTATFAAYFVDAELEALTIRNGQADDAINIKNGSVVARDCSYLDGAGDAVDYDFCTGTDWRTVVSGFPDDALDFSGARMRIEDARVESVGDKAFSVGEGSTVEIARAYAQDVNYGLGVKDGSDARVEDLTLLRANLAIAMYTKKPSFPSPRAEVTRLVACDVASFLVRDAGSELELSASRRLGEGLMPVHEGLTNEEVEELASLDADALGKLLRRDDVRESPEAQR